jgi:hypothetical protein
MSDPVRNATIFGSFADQGMELLEDGTRNIGIYNGRNCCCGSKVAIEREERFALNATPVLDNP